MFPFIRGNILKKKGKWNSFRYLPLFDRGNKWFDTNSKKVRKKRSMIPLNFVDKNRKKVKETRRYSHYKERCVVPMGTVRVKC